MRALKQTGPLFLILIAVAFLNPANGQESKSDQKEKKVRQDVDVKKLIQEQHFVFKAQTAIPLGARSRQLTPDYDLRVTKESLTSYLPYFGRAYSATPGSSAGLEFTSKNYVYIVKENKKGGWDIAMKPKDIHDIRDIYLTVFKNGAASLQVTSNERQPISFNGYIIDLTEK